MSELLKIISTLPITLDDTTGTTEEVCLAAIAALTKLPEAEGTSVSVIKVEATNALVLGVHTKPAECLPPNGASYRIVVETPGKVLKGIRQSHTPYQWFNGPVELLVHFVAYFRSVFPEVFTVVNPVKEEAIPTCDCQYSATLYFPHVGSHGCLGCNRWITPNNEDREGYYGTRKERPSLEVAGLKLGK